MKHNMLPYIVLALLLGSCESPSTATGPTSLTSAGTGTFKVEEVTSSAGGIVWDMAFTAPDTMIYTLHAGQLKLLNTTTGAIRPVEGDPPAVFAQS